MKIITLLFDAMTKVLTRGEELFVPDSSTKASSISNRGLFMSGDASCIQTIEGGQESSGGGSLRVMVKTTYRLPRLARSADPEVQYVTSDTEFDTIPIHVVVGLPKMVAVALGSSTPGYQPARETYMYLIAKGLQDIVTTFLGHNATQVAPADVNVLIAQALAPDAPLRRALAKLQPLDVTTGDYGTVPVEG